MKKIAWLLITILSLCLVFSSCGNGKDDDDNQGDKLDDKDSWYSDLDFKKESVKVKMNKTIDAVGDTRYFHYSTKYLTADKVSADTVMNKNYERNKIVGNTLNIQLDVTADDLGNYTSIVEQNSMMSTPAYDVIYLPCHCVSASILNGMLYNINSKTETSYFNFDDESWYNDFMDGLTLDKNKRYIMAGDYFMGILQGANVIYMNTDYYDTYVATPVDMTRSDFVDVVAAREFTYDVYAEIIQKGWGSTAGNNGRNLSIEDNIGLMAHRSYWLYPYIYSADTFVFERDTQGKVQLVTDATAFADLVGEIARVYNISGTVVNYYGDDTIPHPADYAKQFVNGNVLFVSGFNLGNLEDATLVKMQDKIVIPYPLYDDQEEYITHFDTLADVAIIMKNTPKFSAISAYYQLGNEQSMDILSYYYEYTLKFKYSDDPLTSTMLDIVKETIAAPGSTALAEAIYLHSGLTDSKLEMKQIFIEAVRSNTPSSVNTKFQEVYQAWKEGLDEVKEIFEHLN